MRTVNHQVRHMRTCCSKGAMPGTNRSAENSMVPSTLKWFCANGSRNSRKVVLKNASYSAWSICTQAWTCLAHKGRSLSDRMLHIYIEHALACTQSNMVAAS